MKLNKVFKFLFILCILGLPFNALPYFRGIFGEMSNEAAFYPLFIGVVLLIFKMIVNNKIELIINHNCRIIYCFLGGILISALFNLNVIGNSYYKGRTGIERFLLSLFIIVFCILSLNFIYLTIKKNNIDILKIRKYILASFILPAVYSLFEILHLSFNYNNYNNFMDKISYFIRGSECGFSQYFKLRAVSGEASWYSMYVAFIFPWILSYVFTEKRKLKYILLNLYIILTIMCTYSRTGYIILFIEFILFFILFIKYLNKSIYINLKVIFPGVVLLGVALYFIFNKIELNSNFASLLDKTNNSNITRFNSQRVAIDIGVRNPLFGIGLGQYGFYFKSLITNYFVNNELYDVLTLKIWPSTHNIHLRILCEMGFSGLVIWIYLWMNLIKSVIKKLNQKPNVIGIILIVSILGVLLSGFNKDNFSYFEYWITIAICYVYLNKSSKT